MRPPLIGVPPYDAHVKDRSWHATIGLTTSYLKLLTKVRVRTLSHHRGTIEHQKEKKEDKQTKHTTIYTDKNTQINKNRLNTLKTGSPVKSPFFCSGENLTSKPWD